MKRMWRAFWDWLFEPLTPRWVNDWEEPAPEEIMFARSRNAAPCDVLVSFYADRSLYDDLRTFGHRQCGRIMRASIKVGLGVFAQNPAMMEALDTRGSQQCHISLLVDEATSNQLEAYRRKDKLSCFLRASAEVGILLFRAHGGLVSTLGE